MVVTNYQKQAKSKGISSDSPQSLPFNTRTSKSINDYCCNR